MSTSTTRFIQTSIPLALFAGIAVAQPPPPPPAAGERMIERRGEVRVENGGPPEVVINGQRIAPDRIRLRGDGTFEVIGGPDEAIVEVIEVPRGPQARRMPSPEPPRPMIGVVLAPVEPLLARHLKLDPSNATMVADVMPGSPAMEAGLVPGDILLEIGGEPASIERIGEIVARKGPDGEVKIWVLHDGEKRAVKLRPRMMAPPMAEPPSDMRPMPRRGGPGMVFEFEDREERGSQDGDWQDLRGALERLRDRMGGEVRDRLEAWREQWEGPWGEEHIRRPLREFREQTRREYERLMHEMERYEQEMRERLEGRWRQMQEEWRRMNQELERREAPRPPEAEGDRPRGEQPPRNRPRRDGGEGGRGAPRPGDAPPIPATPA
jgi:hypothetical protein